MVAHPIPRLAAVAALLMFFMLLVGGLSAAGPVAAAAPHNPAANTITVTTNLDDFTNNGNCSLREAIEAANDEETVDACVAGAGPTTIVLPRSTFVLTITMGSGNGTGALDLTGNMTLRPGPCTGFGCLFLPVITANPGWTDRLLWVHPQAAVTLQSIILSGADNAWAGAALYNQGTLTVLGGRLLDNTSTSSGGALNNTGTVHISGTLFSGNESANTGGALFNAAGGTVAITSTTMTNNQAALRGGAIDNFGVLTALTLTLSTNSTAGEGGALYNGSQMLLVGSVITDNTAFTYGGGLANYEDAVISQTQVLSNVVAGGVAHGGGVFSTGELTLAQSTVAHNRAVVGGGVASNLSVSVIDSAVLSNTASVFGGGLAGFVHVSTNNATFSGNTAATGGGVYLTGPGTKFLRFSTIAGNQANNGPGLWTAGNLQAVAILLAGNTISGTLAADDCYANATNLFIWTNVNLVEAPGNCNVASGGSAVLHDVPAHLAPLDDYGGPTLTHQPYRVSPAVNAGTSFLCPLTDQRGQPRPTGPACDIGAVEGAGPGPLTLFMPLLNRNP